MDDHGARTGTWTDIVRRARLPMDLYAAALTLASYANADGTGIRCSVSRLAVDCGISYACSRKYFAKLRSLGLIEVAKRGNRRRGLTDEYRLILRQDLLDQLDLPNPEAYKRMVADVSRIQQKTSAERARQFRQRKRERQDAEAENNATGHANEERYSEEPEPVYNPTGQGEEQGEITREPREGGALLDGITLQTSRNNATVQAADLRVSSAHLPSSTLHVRTTFHMETAEPSLERSGSSGPQPETHTEFSEVAEGFDDALAEARAALATLEDRGVALRAAVRAELGADAPPDEVILLAYERARRRRAG